MFNSSDRNQPPQKSLKIQQDDKFFSRLLSKESSMACPSSKVLYYGGRPGSVPFLWESQPGTPKSKSREESLLLPPLTPPPSYHYYMNSHKNIKNPKKQSKTPSNLLNTLFPKKMTNFSLNKKNTKPSTNSFWSSQNSSMLVSLNSSSSITTATTTTSSSSTAARFRGRSSTSTSQFSSSSSSLFDWRGDIEEHREEEDVGTSPNSTLCFGCYRL